MKVEVPVVSSDTFTWVPAQKMFVAEASDLPNMPFFAIKSARTGREVAVGIERENRDTEGEIHSWVFQPMELADRDLFTVLVFND